MTAEEMLKKTLSMIEEINPNNKNLTDDPDIAAKQVGVMNQVMFELARIKKIPRYVEMSVTKGQTVTLEDIEKECGNEVYQIKLVSGVPYADKADGTVLKFFEDGVAELEVYVYPERITESANLKGYEFELSADALEVMPYGIAADLLKSDVSSEHGKVYSSRYESMLQRLDTRYRMLAISVEGGVSV